VSRGLCLSLGGPAGSGKASRSARRLAAFRVVAASQASTTSISVCSVRLPSWTVTPLSLPFCAVSNGTGFLPSGLSHASSPPREQFLDASKVKQARQPTDTRRLSCSVEHPSGNWPRKSPAPGAYLGVPDGRG